MEFRQLEYFVEVALCQNFTRAAEHLLVAQPAISKAIQKLEQDLQITLFDRSSKHIVLTPEGEVFLEHARAILSRVEEARTELNEMRGLEKGEVRIGLPSMVGSYYFPAIIKDFKRKFKSLQISVVEEGTLQVQKLIEKGEVDLGIIVVDHPPDHLEYIPLFHEELVVCVPLDHPFVFKDHITYHDLVKEPLILFKEGYFQRQLILETSKQTGITPNVSFSANQLSLIKSFVSEGLGVTLFLRMIAATDPKLVPISLDPPVYLSLAVAWNKNRYLSIASQAFLDFLKNRKE
ncbi:LysR family transcriptional regulator [Ammoniphilus sp. CFH 90114]|uniref:LysR family transcriptional regulator n=1 Tax=Ammoniphilus sp. CFH 90114 TaxID=2493665 RepID=UPI00100E4754|nr:LysR family transcriptional regulator [Ammoniphilus sp. CFH 90114]RXT05694.1 LysR family transcriptional regulator [Ammoniphilus sp. CFH 90114]